MVMSSNAMKSHNLRGMMDLILKKTRGLGLVLRSGCSEQIR